MMAHRQLVLAVLFMALLAACGSPAATTEQMPTSSGAEAATAAGQALPVVTTTSIIADLVRNVGGDRVVVSAILPPGTDPHTFAPTPSDIQAVSKARILFENGLGLEEWLAELTQNAGGERVTIVVTEGITAIEGGEHGHEEEHSSASSSAEAHDEDEHGAESKDPHMWFDVQNTIKYVENIRDGLKQLDTAASATYDANATIYIDQLKQLDAEIEQQVQMIPQERRKLITNHDTFGYFAKRYGFTVVGSVFEGVSTEEEPSAQQVGQLVQLIQEQNVPAIFTENTVNSRLAEQIADEAEIKVVTNLYTDSLGMTGSEADSYVKMMRYNVQQIVSALK
jgi:ABC-type Zn uptake system ZnuABC Zn-binding protein ZnuA